MKRKNVGKKLKLGTRTVRRLQTDDLNQINGGLPPWTWSCDVSRCYNCSGGCTSG